MEPYKANKLSLKHELSDELNSMLRDVRETYGEYKGYLKNMEFDYKYFLEHLLINDIFYSFKIDNSKLTKENMFYMQYRIKDNESIIFNNIKKAIVYGVSKFDGELTIDFLNKLHKITYTNCKKNNQTKGSGNLRKKQNYILKPGLAGSVLSFVPPIYTEVNGLMKDLCYYLNNSADEELVKLAISHIRLEIIHPYVSGNGKLGRFLFPILYSGYRKEPPLLFLSQALSTYTNTYFTLLSNPDNQNEFIKMFFQTIINMCNTNIKLIKKLNAIYKKDYDSFKEDIKGTTIYKIYPIMIKRIVFTTNDIIEDTKLHINSVNKVLNKLVEKGYLIKEKKNDNNRVTFRYKNMYDIYCE